MGMQKVQLRRLLGPMKDGAAIFLGNDKKTFMMFIGQNEAAAIIREFQNQNFTRPLTHDLFHYSLLGFDITVKSVIISTINENTFYATLVLEQPMFDENKNPTGKRHEVRIDARPSDSIIMALKCKSEIYVTDEVMTTVRDVSDELKQMPMLNFEGGVTPAGAWEGMEMPDLEVGETDDLEDLPEEDVDDDDAPNLGKDQPG